MQTKKTQVIIVLMILLVITLIPLSSANVTIDSKTKIYLATDESVVILDSDNTNSSLTITVINGNLNGTIYSYGDTTGIETKLKPISNCTLRIDCVNNTVSSYRVNGKAQVFNSSEINSFNYIVTNTSSLEFRMTYIGHFPSYIVIPTTKDAFDLAILVYIVIGGVVIFVLAITIMKKIKK